MANFRQTRELDSEAGVDVRTFGVTFDASPPRPFISPRTTGWHQLVYASRGVMTVRAANHDWLVIPHRALWIPAGVPYSIRFKGEVALRCLYFRCSRSNPAPFKDCSALNITPLFRELILRANLLGALDRHVSEQRHLIAVIRDELRALPLTPLQLPIPVDERAARFARLIESTPLESRPTLDRLLRRSGASQRTMERIFRTQTSMSLGRWIRRHDLLLAVGRLAAGERVAHIADSLGYNSPSAFIAMFRRELGQSPARYLGSIRRQP